MSKPLSSVLTSYDFLKTAALLLMLVDHVGYYFYPDDVWMRVVGRFSAPVWLFLVGYARSRDLSWRLWAGMLVLAGTNYVAGMAQCPVNILATIIVCRLALDPLMGWISKTPQALYPVVVLLFLGVLGTYNLIEYGTPAMLLVMAGYLVRNGVAMALNDNQILQFAGVVSILYAAVTIITFPDFGRMDDIMVFAGMMLLMLFLTRFRFYDFPALTRRLPAMVAGIFRLAGRRSLEFYVLHLVAFKLAALWLGLHNTSLFNFHIF